MDVAACRAIETTGIVDDDFDEPEWLEAASVNPSFGFLNDSEEDIYSENDGII